MDQNLSELLDRLDWARSEIRVLQSELKAWVGRSTKVSSGPHELQGFMSIIVEAHEAIPLPVRARAGTTTNEIRACLDGLASTLAERNDQDGAYFPIANHEEEFTKDARLRKRLAKFTETDRDALLALRPFAVGIDGDPGNLLLYGLHHADIRRKHHRLVAKSTGSSIAFRNGNIGSFVPEPAIIKIPGKTRIGRLSDDSWVTIGFEPLILYAEPNVLRGRPLVETLYEFANIAEAAIRTFL